MDWPPAGVPPSTYVLSTGITQISFAVRHLGISVVRGTFDAYEGRVVVAATAERSAIEVSVLTSSVNTGNQRRDRHLRSTDFLDVRRYPTMSFRSSSIHAREDGSIAINGILTIHGCRVDAALHARLTGIAAFPPGAAGHDPCDRYGFSATGRVRRSECGVGFGAPIVADEVDLEIDGQLVSAAADRLDQVSMARFDHARKVLYREVEASTQEVEAARQLLSSALRSVDAGDVRQHEQADREGSAHTESH